MLGSLFAPFWFGLSQKNKKAQLVHQTHGVMMIQPCLFLTGPTSRLQKLPATDCGLCRNRIGRPQESFSEIFCFFQVAGGTTVTRIAVNLPSCTFF
jgi:hypothetical protein